MLQGWISSTRPDAVTFSEAVIVRYDETVMPLDVLVEIHLRTHKSTSSHAMRGKYRSAIYTFSQEQQQRVGKILHEKRTLFEKPIITQVYPFRRFKQNREEYTDYYRKNSERPFCKKYIDPKLQFLLESYGDFVQ